MKTEERIIAILRARPLMTRGTLSVKAVRKSGVKAYNLQYHRKAKYFAKSVANDELRRYERSTEAYRMFMKLVQRYVDDETRRGIRTITKEVRRERREARDAR